MAFTLPPLTRKWNLQDPDASDTSEPNTPTAVSHLDERSRPHKAPDFMKLEHDTWAGNRLDASGEPVAPKGVSGSPVDVARPNPPAPYWSRRKILSYISLVAVTTAIIFSEPLVDKFSWPSSGPHSAWLPPRNLLQCRISNAAKFNTTTLDLSCPESQSPACELSHSLYSLDLAVSHNCQDIESLGSYLGTLLRPTKMAASRGECSYFPQLRLDVNQALDRTFGIQDSLNAALISTGNTLSFVFKSRVKAERTLAAADQGADGRMWIIWDAAGKEQVYRATERWLNILEDYAQKLKSREGLLRWELGRQNGLQQDLKQVEKEIEGLGIEPDEERKIPVAPSCTAFNIRRVERRLMDTMARAAEDEVAAGNLSKYYDTL